jgi:chromosome segregation ATPase
MEPTTDLQDARADRVPPPLGELVIRNDRLTGTRHPLASPVTLIGRAPGCDIRLDADGVEPLHCVVAFGSVGVVVRDLATGNGTLVNDKLITSSALREGDLLVVGPFCLEIRLPALTPAPDNRQERDALRIQAAAVVAQQAALTEEEIRLGRRLLALEQQEQQLAAHLEEKRQRLVTIRDSARREHNAVRDARAAFERRVEEVMGRLAQSREDIADNQRQVETERRRLFKLRGKLKKRFHRHWVAERAAMRRSQATLQGERLGLEKEIDRTRREREELVRERLRLNGEVELARRQMHSSAEEIKKTQAELQDRARTLGRREADLQSGEQVLAAQRRDLEQAHLLLAKENEGLEGRIAQYRRMVREEEQKLARLQDTAGECMGREPGQTDFVLPPRELPPPSQIVLIEGENSTEGHLQGRDADLANQLAGLEKLAGELADQRLFLAEQYERFAEARVSWQRNQEAAAAELEALARRFEEREQNLRSGECRLEEGERDLSQRSEDVVDGEKQLEAWKARLAAARADWEGERNRFISELTAREDLVEKRLAVLAQLRERWNERRRRQVLRLRSRSTACEELRRECAVLREELLRRTTILGQEQRTLAERALAMERYRQECLGKAANAKVAEKRLEHLRRREATLLASAKRSLAEERRRLETLSARTEERSRLVHTQAQELGSQEADLASRQAAWEQQQLATQEQQRKLQGTLQTLRQQRSSYERQLQELRDEVERLARILLDETNHTPLPMGQAA